MCVRTVKSPILPGQIPISLNVALAQIPTSCRTHPLRTQTLCRAHNSRAGAACRRAARSAATGARCRLAEISPVSHGGGHCARRRGWESRRYPISSTRNVWNACLVTPCLLGGGMMKRGFLPGRLEALDFRAVMPIAPISATSRPCDCF